MYANQKLSEWSVGQDLKQGQYKLDVGKSCVRFKKYEHIPPLSIIATLIQKLNC